MAQMQWLGDLGAANSQAAAGIGQGIGNIATGYVGEKHRQEELKLKYENLDFKKKMDGVRLINSTLSHIPEEQRMDVLADPEIQALYESAGVPLPKFVSTEGDEGGFGLEDVMGGIGDAAKGFGGRLKSWFGGEETVKGTPQTTEKSPYAEYPDAFQEDGVWKVKRNGKTYRIEE